MSVRQPANREDVVVRDRGTLQSFLTRVMGIGGLITALGAVGCARNVAGDTTAEYPVVLEETYTVGAPDLLAVSVYPQAELNQQVRIRPDGKISFSLVGDLYVQGKTPEQIDAMLTKALSEYLRAPEVTVSVVEFLSKRIYVVGEVQRPGLYPYQGATSVVDAVMEAGGYTRRAQTYRFILVRQSETDPKIIDVDWREIEDSGKAQYNLFLQPGDLLLVPPTGIARLGYQIEALLFPFQPALGIASAVSDLDSLRNIGN